MRSKNAEVFQRQNAERAVVSEQRAKREANAARDEARASDLVSRAITLLGHRPGAERPAGVGQRGPRADDATRDRPAGRSQRGENARRAARRRWRSERRVDDQPRPGSWPGPRSRRRQSSRRGRFARAGDGQGRRGESVRVDRQAAVPTASWLAVERRRPLARRRIGGDGGRNGVARRWNARTGALLGQSVHGAGIRQIAFSPDGRLFATAAGEAARVWLAADGSLVARLQHQFPVDGVSFNPDGTLLMTIAHDARLFHTNDWQREPLVLDQPGNILTASFAPVGPLVATGGRDDLAMVWDSRDGSKRHPDQSLTAAT